MPDKLIGFTQSSYPAFSLPPMRITKHLFVKSGAKMGQNRDTAKFFNAF